MLNYFSFKSWKNTSKDTLTCANPECSASLSINFEHDPPTEATSLAAWNCLCLNYRKQLLTAHIPYCSFRCEAQCWFPQTEADNSITNTNGIVPSFLLSVVPEMILFENQSSDKVQIQLIYQTILHKSSDFDNYLVKFSTSLPNGSESRNDYSYCVVDPDQVTAFIKEQKHTFNSENQPLSLYLKSLLDEWCSGHSYITTENEGEEDTNSCYSNATTGRLYRTQQSVLLATLGWSLASSGANKKASHRRNNIIVECSCCLSRALVPITINSIGNSDCPTTQDDNCVNETTGATSKRVRVIDTAQNSSTSTGGANRIFWRTAPQSSYTKPTIKVNNLPMHPLTSHRHFCPYLGGSLLHNRIGWEIIINRMLQWKMEQDKSS